MHYTTSGSHTGLRVSEYVLGTANFAAAPNVAGATGSRQVFTAFVDAGGTTVDTSNLYHAGEAETRLGELLGHEREDLVIGHEVRREQGDPGPPRNDRKQSQDHDSVTRGEPAASSHRLRRCLHAPFS